MASLPTVTVTGMVYQEDHVTPYTGPIFFIRDVLLRHNDGTVILPAGTPIRYEVVNGVVAVQLLYVDASGWAPADWQYEVRIPRGSVLKSYALAPSVDDPDTVNLGDLLVTQYTHSDGIEFAPVNHTHDIAAAARYAIDVRDRVHASGEFVLPRYQGGASFQMVSGRMYATHFKALTTETILSVQTTCKQAAVGSTGAWIGYLKWTGSQYLLDSISVNDPTRWTALANYPTTLFQTDDAHFGAADLTRPGFFKVKDQEYIQLTQWVGSGAGPKLMGQLVNDADSFVEPRENGYMDLAAPPSSALMAAWLVGSPFKFQGRMTR